MPDGRRASGWARCLGLGAAVLTLAACGEMARYDVAAGTGRQPTLPAPAPTLIPTVNIAPAIGWPAGVRPLAAQGTRLQAFASKLDHPRWLYVLPNGDVLVAETNAPPKPEDGRGLRGWLMGLVMQRAGAATPSANRITLLRDTDGDGLADERSVLLQGLNSPFGLAAAAGNTLPERFANGMFIGQHGSWNRRPHSGYKVIFVPFVDGQPQGEPLEVLGGFLSAEGRAHGRPVGVVLDRSGALLVADDVGNVVWRVSAAR